MRRVGKAAGRECVRRRAHHPARGSRWWARRKSAFAHPTTHRMTRRLYSEKFRVFVGIRALLENSEFSRSTCSQSDSGATLSPRETEEAHMLRAAAAVLAALGLSAAS